MSCPVSNLGRATLYNGDCLEVMRELPSGFVDAIVTDPPGGLNFMGKDWDSDKGGRDHWIDWLVARLTEARRVIRPGGFMLCWAIPRTSHWTAMAIEQAGWTIRDRISHLFGCLSDDTEILTGKGWEHFQKLAIGDTALAFNAASGAFQWEQIQDVVTYDYSDTAYRIRSDHTDQIVSRNHRCLVERGGSLEFRYAETLQRQESVPILEDVRGLLEAFCVPESHAGESQQGLLSGVRRCADRKSEYGQEASRPSMSVVRQPVPSKGSGSQGVVEISILLDETRGNGEGLRSSVPWKDEGGRGTRQERVDREVSGVLPEKDDWRAQPGVKGRRHSLQEARQLQGCAIRQMPEGIPSDGQKGWIRDGAQACRGHDHRPLSASARGCPSRGSRSDEQLSGQPIPVCEQQRPQTVRASRFTASTLATVEPVFYNGVVWCVRIPSGAFVARRNGKVFVTGNSGFPKSKSCLKPAVEDWWLCKAPGKLLPLQIQAATIGISKSVPASVSHRTQSDCYGVFREAAEVQGVGGHDPNSGRWPANLCLGHSEMCIDDGECVEGCPVRMLGEQSGKLHTGTAYEPDGKRMSRNIYGATNTLGRVVTFGDSGTAARFFYCAKASRADRQEGCEGLEKVLVQLKTEGSNSEDHHESWEQEDQRVMLRVDTAQSPPRVTCVSGTQDRDATAWSTMLFGNGRTGPSLLECKSITLTKINSITQSATLSWLIRLLTSASTADVCLLTENGLNSVATAEISTPHLTITFGKTASLPGVGTVASGTRMRINGNAGSPSDHPTVKSTALMQWLCRLITPEGGTVLDPFAGSGSTGKACMREGFRFIGIEEDTENDYFEIARRRIEHEIKKIDGDMPLFSGLHT